VEKYVPIRPVHERYIWPATADRLTTDFARTNINMKQISTDVFDYCVEKPHFENRPGVLGVGATSGAGKTHLVDVLARGNVDSDGLRTVLSHTHVLPLSLNSGTPLDMNENVSTDDLIMRAVLAHYAADPVFSFSRFRTEWKRHVRGASLAEFLKSIHAKYASESPMVLLLIDEISRYDEGPNRIFNSSRVLADVLRAVDVTFASTGMWCGVVVTSLDYKTVQYGVNTSSSSRPVKWTMLPLLPTGKQPGSIEDIPKDSRTPNTELLLHLLSKSRFARQLLAFSSGHPRSVEIICQWLNSPTYAPSSSWEAEMSVVRDRVARLLHDSNANFFTHCGAAIAHGLLKRDLFVSDPVPLTKSKLETLIATQVVVNRIPGGHVSIVPTPSLLTMSLWSTIAMSHKHDKFYRLGYFVYHLLLECNRLDPKSFEYVHALWHCASSEARHLFQQLHQSDEKPAVTLSELYDGMTLQCGPDPNVLVRSCTVRNVHGDDLLADLDWDSIITELQNKNRQSVLIVRGNQPGFDVAVFGLTDKDEVHVTLVECKYSDPTSETKRDASEVMDKVSKANSALVHPLIHAKKVLPQNFAFVFATLGETTKWQEESTSAVKSIFEGSVFTANRKQTLETYGPLVAEMMFAGTTLPVDERTREHIVFK
jgi:hypothetical protein